MPIDPFRSFGAGRKSRKTDVMQNPPLLGKDEYLPHLEPPPERRDTAMAHMTEDAKWHWAEGNKYAVEAAKSILLVNGAAAVATLTFIGNLKLQPTNALIISMVLFAIAAMASAMLFFFAYLTQLNYG